MQNETEEMVQWAVAEARPAGRRKIRRHFGCTKSEATEAAELARESLIGEGSEVELTPPVLTTKRKFDPSDPAFRGPVVEKLRKPSGAMSTSELADFLGVDMRDAQLMIRSLKSSGYQVDEVDGRYSIGKLRPDSAVKMKSFDRLEADTITIGVISDTHLCNKNQRLDVMEMAYNEFGRQDVDYVFHCGNLIDGYRERYNGDEVMFRNVTDQCMYAADYYPSRPGITTQFITGTCHEGWYAKQVGLNIGWHMEDVFKRQGRDDMEYIGNVERDIPISIGGAPASVLRLLHSGGGSSYAQSYKPQKIVRSYQGGEKPAIILMGHFHKLFYFYPRGVHVLMAGTCCDQTRWMRKKGIEAHVGFSTFTVAQDEHGGICRIIPNVVPFYDAGYHYDADEWSSAMYEAMRK